MSKYSATKLLKRAVAEQMAILKRLDLRKLDDNSIERQIRKLLGLGYVSRPMRIEKTTVFRVRPNRSSKCFKNAYQLWWPKPRKVKKRGRCNEINKPVFYCADAERTAIIEVRPELGDMLTILEAGLIDPAIKPQMMSVGIHEYTAKSNPKYGGTPAELDSAQQEFLKREGLTDTNPLLNAYLTEEFMRDVENGNEHEYKITCAIARILLAQEEFFNDDGTQAPTQVIDGLAYPSIRADRLGANFAFTTTAANRLYKPVSCTLCQVVDKSDETHYQVGIIKQSKSIADNGRIEWVIPKPEEVRLTASTV